ncbi:hypothetical protein [Salinigranum marinum]|uniref:hypothetical protein n=1 Tax=Salinigranum marinum TaxID=1515595 RepID=UPI002989D2F7|nr:hypothetical protein [Salinigranum marinum]
MWNRRSILAGAGVSLLSISVAGQLQNGPSDSTNPYVREITFEGQTVDVDSDGDRERPVWVSFVPARRLVAVRLEARVEDATDPDLARRLDQEGDGWYVIARRTRLGDRHRGETRFLRASRSRRLPGADGRWLVESRGFQTGSTGVTDSRGFDRGDVLRLVVVPYGDDPVVVAEHVVGVDG